MKTPGSPISMPRTRNSTENRVLPAPALPQTRVGRPRGRPPPVISSRPRMPLLTLGNADTGARFLAGTRGLLLAAIRATAARWGRSSVLRLARGTMGAYFSLVSMLEDTCLTPGMS